MVQTTRAVPPPLPMHRVATAAASSSTLSQGPAYHVLAAPGDFLARLEELEKGAEPAPLWGGAPTVVPAAEPPLKTLALKQRTPVRSTLDDDSPSSTFKALEQQPAPLWGVALAPAAEPPLKTVAPRRPLVRTTLDDDDVLSSLKALEAQIDRARQRTVLAVKNSPPAAP
jgi:hypothetical protein